MWTCALCNRSFRNQNQWHSCTNDGFEGVFGKNTPEIMWALINTASVDTNSLSKYRTISCLFICSFTLIFIFMMRNFLNGKNNTFTNMWFIIGVFQLLMIYN